MFVVSNQQTVRASGELFRLEVQSMDEVAVEHTSISFRRTQTGRVRTPGPPTSFSSSISPLAAIKLSRNHSYLSTPTRSDIPCQSSLGLTHPAGVSTTSRDLSICDLYRYRRGRGFQSLFRLIFSLLESFDGWGIFGNFVT